MRREADVHAEEREREGERGREGRRNRERAVGWMGLSLSLLPCSVLLAGTAAAGPAQQCRVAKVGGGGSLAVGGLEAPGVG